MMKRLALTIALAGLSGGALAADLRGPIIEAPPPLPVPVAVFGWTGGYIGGNVGVGAASPSYGYQVSSPGSYTPGYSVPEQYHEATEAYTSDGYDVPGYSTAASSSHGSQSLHSAGVIGGVQAGYNYAFGGFGGFGIGGPGLLPVIGIEADFDGTSIKSATALDAFAQGYPYGNAAYVGVGSKINYVGTVRGRLGVAFDRLLVYGTGGFAYADTDSYVNSTDYGIAAHKNNFHTGIAYGGGVEFALTNNLLLRAEYLHYDFNKKTIVHGNDTCGCGGTYDVYEKPHLDVVRAGLSYRFDALVHAPVIARY